MALTFSMNQLLWSHSSSSDNSSPGTVVFSDVDNDGDQDIYIGVEKAGGSQGSQLWKNDGSGHFTLSQTFSPDRVAKAWSVDIDGDGDKDLVTRALDAPIRVYTNNGSGSFTLASTPGGTVNDADVGDLDGDGDVDIFVALKTGGYQVLMNNGSGSFSVASSPSSGSTPLSVTLADLNHDGDLDVVSYEEDNGRILTNNGSGGFSSTGTFGTVYGGLARSGDVTGDGYNDVLVNNLTGSSSGVVLFRNDGSGGLGTQLQTFTGDSPYLFADVDGDGDLDGLGSSLLLNNGSGVFSNSGLTFQDPVFTYNGTPVDGTPIAAGDVDGDGDLDLAVSFYSYYAGSYQSQVRIFLNTSAPPTNTDGTLTAGSGVSEPVAIGSTIDTTGEAINVFDFTLTDGGGSDSVALGVNQLVVHTSGTGDFSKVTWRLNGPDAANVTGVYNSSAGTITFSSLALSVANGGSETYTINAYFNNTSGLSQGQTYILSIDGDTDVTVGSGSTRMASGQIAVNNGTGSVVNVNAAPTVSNAPADITVTEDMASNVDLSAVTFADADNDALTVTLTLNAGTFSSPADGAGVGSDVTETLVNGHTITLAGSAADITTYLDTTSNIQYTGASNASGNDAATLTISASDSQGNSLASSPVIKIDITNINDAPSNLSISSASVDENSSTAIPLNICALSTTDPDSGDAFTYSVVGGVDQADFQVTGSTLQFVAGATLDYETQSSYNVTVRTTDSGGLVYDKALAISLNNINEAPTVATPIADQLASVSHAFSFVVDSNTFADEDAGQTLTYSATLADNSALPAWLIFNAATRTFSGTPASGDVGAISVKVTATDNGIGNLIASDVFDLSIINAPAVSSIVRDDSETVPITSTSVEYTVTFSESVTGVDLSDFTLTTTGTASGNISSANGSGGTYTINVNSLGGDGTIRLDLNSSGTGIENGSSVAIIGGYTSAETYTLDNTAPVAPGLALHTDSGSSSSDGITNAAQVDVSGLEAGASWVYTTNSGSTWLAGSGSSFTLAGDGLKNVAVRQTDIAGNTSSASADFSYTLDATVSAPTISLHTDSGANASDNITNVGTVDVSGLEAGGSWEYSDNNGSSWQAGSDSSVTLSGDGLKNVLVRQVDAAGNASANSTLLDFTLDTAGPATTFTDLAFSADSGTSDSDFLTQTAVQTLSATLSTAPDPTDIVYGSLDNGATWTDITAKVSGTVLSWDSVALSGGNTLKLKVTDAAGNDGAVVSQAYVLDIAGPTITFSDLTFSADSGTSSSDLITNSATQTLSATLSSTPDPTDIIYGSLDNGSTWTDISAKVSGAVLSWDGIVLTGADTMKLKVIDAAGNDSAVFSHTYALDATAPSALVTTADISIGDVVTTAQSSETGFVYLVSSADTPADYAALEALFTAGAVTRSPVLASNTNTSISTSGMTAGPYKVYSVDTAGNISAVSADTITIVDNHAPALGNIPSATQTILIGQVVPLPDFTVADADGDTLTLTITTNKGDLGGLVDADPLTAGIQLTGSATQINADLVGATFMASTVCAATITFSLSDGAAQTVTATYNLDAIAGGGGGSDSGSDDGGSGGVTDDGDTVPTTVEDNVPVLPPADGGTPVVGDGNGDGIKDSAQVNVTSLTFLDTDTAVSHPGNAAPVYVTFVANSNDGLPDTQVGNTTNITHIGQLDAPSNLPDGVQMPLGEITFSADVDSAGTTETFSLFVDASTGINSYWKQNAHGEWVDIASQITYVGDKIRIDFSIEDGGPLDEDGLANGLITDPGALGVAVRPAPSTAQLVAGLYVGYYDRAPDAEGLAFWVDQIDQGGATLDDISALFASHPRFAQEYGGLTDTQFVAALYENILGNIGDADGLVYWQSQLTTKSKSEVVAEFVASSLSIDLSAAVQDGSISQDDYVVAYERQSLFDNQVEAGLVFAALGDITVPSHDDTHLGDDHAYLAAIHVLENISSDYASVSSMTVIIAGIRDNPDGIDILLS